MVDYPRMTRQEQYRGLVVPQRKWHPIKGSQLLSAVSHQKQLSYAKTLRHSFGAGQETVLVVESVQDGVRHNLA